MEFQFQPKEATVTALDTIRLQPMEFQFQPKEATVTALDTIRLQPMEFQFQPTVGATGGVRSNLKDHRLKPDGIQEVRSFVRAKSEGPSAEARWYQ